MAEGPSKHLFWSELQCKDGTPYPEKWRDTRAIDLALVFEDIRSFFGGKSITVLSAYRTPAHNRSIGGARFSQHLEGRALDLRPPAGVSLKKFYDGIRANATRWGIKGLGKYLTFVHVDIRPSDRLVTWSGTGVKDDQ